MEDGATASGSVNSVQRVGTTVRRPSGPWTPAVQHLLGFLERAGVEGCPRPLGTDEQGREVVSYIEGSVAMRPWPETMLSGTGIVDASRWLHRYLEAAAEYTALPGAAWRDPEAAARQQPGEVVLHGDLGPWNMIFSDVGDFVGVIDWDLAQPGRPELSIGQLAYYHVPLRDDDHAAQCGFSGGIALDRGARLLLIGSVFRMSAEQLIQAALDYLQDEIDRTVRLAAAGVEPWVEFLSRGDDRELQSDWDWIASTGDQLLTGAVAFDNPNKISWSLDVPEPGPGPGPGPGPEPELSVAYCPHCCLRLRIVASQHVDSAGRTSFVRRASISQPTLKLAGERLRFVCPHHSNSPSTPGSEIALQACGGGAEVALQFAARRCLDPKPRP